MVLMLPGWEDSAGAKMENAVAEKLGIPRKQFTLFFLEDFTEVANAKA